MNIVYINRDLTNDEYLELSKTTELAMDTELTGIDVKNDKLCLVQMRAKDSDNFYLIKIDDDKNYQNLIKLLVDKNITKIFHYARMDILMIYKRFKVWTNPIFCSKIANLLARPKKGHTLQHALSEIFKIDIAKDETCSDWTKELTESQKRYATTDVLYLHQLKDYLNNLLIKQNIYDIAKNCFDFLKTRAEIDLLLDERDIFAHNPKLTTD